MKDHYQQLLIAGMGKTGKSVQDFLSQFAVPADCCDDLGDYQDCADLVMNDYPFIFKSPGLRPDQFTSLNQNVQVVNDVELLLRMTMKPLILVTGTNGKSTLVSLLEAVLRENNIAAIACGNNGVPVLEAWLQQPDMFVVELSSYQLENIASLASMSAVVLNVGVDHVDRYRGLEEYTSVKEKIYCNTVNSVYPVNRGGELDYGQGIVGYRAMHAEYQVVDDNIYLDDDLFCSIEEINLIGKHNQLNVCAALALLHGLGLEKKSVLAALNKFVGLPHRMELVCTDANKRQWINDSKSTNVHSTRAALMSVHDPVVLIMGGRGKGEEYDDLFVNFSENIAALITYGETAEKIYNQAENIQQRYRVENVAAAVLKADEFAATVLFSPACASFDQYRDFNQRGDDFKQQVAEVVTSC